MTSLIVMLNADWPHRVALNAIQTMANEMTPETFTWDIHNMNDLYEQGNHCHHLYRTHIDYFWKNSQRNKYLKDNHAHSITCNNGSNGIGGGRTGTCSHYYLHQTFLQCKHDVHQILSEQLNWQTASLDDKIKISYKHTVTKCLMTRILL
jgi:hypothetical protein